MVLGRAKSLLGRNEEARHLLISGSGSLAAPLLNFAFVPLVMRSYGPAEYGLWVLLMSVVLIPGNISTLRYELAIVMADDEKQAGHVFALCALLIVVVAAVSALVLALFEGWMGALFGVELTQWFWAVPVLVVLVGFFLAGSSWCTRAKAFGICSASLMTRAAVVNLAQVLMPMMGLKGEAGLIVGSVVGYGASAAVLAAGMLARGSAEFFRGLRGGPLVSLMRRFRNFPVFSVPYTFVGTLKQEGVKLLFGGFGSSALVGDFGFASRLTSFPVMLFTSGIRPVLYQKAARHGQVREAQPLIETTLYWLSLLTLPPFLVFIFHTEEIFRAAIGEQWLGAAPYARILALPALAYVHTNWMDRILDVLLRQRLALGLELTFTILGLGSLAAGLFLLGDPTRAVLIQSVILLLSNVVFAIVVYRAAGMDLHGLMRYGVCFAGFGLASLALILILDVVAPWTIAGPLAILLAYGVGGVALQRWLGGSTQPEARPPDLALPAAAGALEPRGSFPS